MAVRSGSLQRCPNGDRPFRMQPTARCAGLIWTTIAEPSKIGEHGCAGHSAHRLPCSVCALATMQARASCKSVSSSMSASPPPVTEGEQSPLQDLNKGWLDVLLSDGVSCISLVVLQHQNTALPEAQLSHVPAHISNFRPSLAPRQSLHHEILAAPDDRSRVHRRHQCLAERDDYHYCRDDHHHY